MQQTRSPPAWPCLAAQQLFANAGFVPNGQIDNLDDHDPELVYVKLLR